MIIGFLKKRLFAVVLASLSALLLGAVSALVFSSVGPALQVLLNPDASALMPLSDLLGETLAKFIEQQFGLTAIAAKSLWRILPVVMVSAAGIRAVLTAFQWAAWEWLSEDFARSLRADLVQGYLRLNPQARRESPSYDDQLAAVLANDVRLVREYIVHFYGGLPRELFQVLFYLGSLILLSPLLFAIFVFGLLPAGAIISRLGKKLRRRSGQALDQVSRVSEWIQQRLQGIETIKHYATEKLEAQKMRNHTCKLMDSFLRAARVKARTSPLMELIAIIAMVMVLLVSFQMVQQGQTSGSILISFFALLGAMSQSAAKLGKYYNSNREGVAALERVEGMLKFFRANEKLALQHDQFHQTEDSSEILSCKDLTVTYSKTDIPALQDFHFKFRVGRIYCICGPSGAGKSTLMNVLLGLVEPNRGQVLWSQHFQKDGLQIGLVPQRVELANFSLAENISYPDASCDEQRFDLAIRAAGLTETVRNLPQGAATSIGEGLVQISGGQAQRILIARLFYHDMNLVMFDEGTSALDPETEALVYQSLRQFAAQGRSVIMIAHRFSALAIADEILLMNQGRLVAHGHPSQLTQHPEFLRLLGGVH
ncbi:MAG: ABC transporter ATP-binding protein [Oligoflexus sp.]